MSYDAQREDYQRLGLRFARSLQNKSASEATRAFAAFGRRFAHDRDSLPQSDSDRAFHLVAMAAKLIDYELPFATDEQADGIIDDGHRILDEALSIDPNCYDALRMQAAASSPSFESFLAFLSDHANEVRAYCEERREEARDDTSEERVRLAQDIAMRPYLRWLAAQAEQALICGHNKEAIRLAHEALAADPHDGADVRFTAMLAYAKLEDEAGMHALAQAHTAQRRRPMSDAWTLLSRIALAHKHCDFDTARQVLRELTQTYPHAAEALIRQNELPDGVFCRLAVTPYSEDELIVAISEATVLLQEGIDPLGRGVLGAWVMQETARIDPAALFKVFSEQSNELQEPWMNALGWQGMGPDGKDRNQPGEGGLS